jgi:hypothetical protein
MLEDYAVLYFGSAMFKIGRLLLIAMMCVHVFACVFYRVKKESAASPDDVTAFFASRAVDPDVGTGNKPSHAVLTKSLTRNILYHLVCAVLPLPPYCLHDRGHHRS